jgi:nicotinamide mononucleotide (NMN) deamidase PncC
VLRLVARVVTTAITRYFQGDREAVRRAAVVAALEGLLMALAYP